MILENEIKELLSRMGTIERRISNLKFRLEMVMELEKITKMELEDELFNEQIQFRYLTQSLYLMVVCFLESKNLNRYLIEFKRVVGRNSQEIYNVDEFEFDNDGSYEFYSVYLMNISMFLRPFKFMHEYDAELERKQSGIFFLEKVLKNTAVIMNNCSPKPGSEAKIYNEVKKVLNYIFPTTQDTGSAHFGSPMKKFIPDILIPELGVAIEYKYAKNKGDLSTQMEAVVADSKGYVGDEQYKLFYSVFVVTSDFLGKDKFIAHWEHLKMPKNWVPIYCIAS